MDAIACSDVGCKQMQGTEETGESSFICELVVKRLFQEEIGSIPVQWRN